MFSFDFIFALIMVVGFSVLVMSDDFDICTHACNKIILSLRNLTNFIKYVDFQIIELLK